MDLEEVLLTNGEDFGRVSAKRRIRQSLRDLTLFGKNS